MKIDKTELARKISQLKSVVPKKTTIDALQGILVDEGYLIAANNELTVKAKLEGVEGERFVIPAKAFDLINNLPAGEVTVTGAKSEVTVQMDKIKNKFKTFLPDDFLYNRKSIEADDGASLPAEKLKKAIGHVLHAVHPTSNNPLMNGMYLSCSGDKLNFVGLDGHRIAWDTLEYTGEVDLIIPRPALEKILQLDLQGDVKISFDKNGALFATDEFEMYTRLIEGTYYKYPSMFNEGDIFTSINRREFLEALNRAQLCGSADDKAPVIFTVTGDKLRIEFKNAMADYEEEIATQVKVEKQLKIGFNPRLLIEGLKAFECENIALVFSAPNAPLIIRAEDSDMKELILPVQVKQ